MPPNQMREVLVVGATGATGRLLVADLLERGCRVKAVVRPTGRLPANLRAHPALTVVRANLAELDDAELTRLVDGCRAVASCLGHTLTFRGMYGPPRRLVADAVRHLCEAVRASGLREQVRFVLMNTAGNRNRDLAEPVSMAERAVVNLIRLLVPPHADNEQAADYLRTGVGQNDHAIGWVAVRPDSLVNADQVSNYVVHPSPTRSAIFNAGRTSRINVAHFMAELITDEATWRQWQGRMPVIYDQEYV